MTVYVSETSDEARGDHLRMVRSGEEERLPFADAAGRVVSVPADAPEWVDRIARDHGYEPQRAEMPTTGAGDAGPATVDAQADD